MLRDIFSFLGWFIGFLVKGSQPDWLPSSADVKKIEKDGVRCILDGAGLPHGNRWWICVSIDLSGRKGEIEARCGPLTNLSTKEPVIKKAQLEADQAGRLFNLLQAAAATRGRIGQAWIRDGFPASMRLSLQGAIVKYRCNLADPWKRDDARVDLAKAILARGTELIGDPAAHGDEITYEQVTRRGREKTPLMRILEWVANRERRKRVKRAVQKNV